MAVAVAGGRVDGVEEVGETAPGGKLVGPRLVVSSPLRTKTDESITIVTPSSSDTLREDNLCTLTVTEQSHSTLVQVQVVDDSTVGGEGGGGGGADYTPPPPLPGVADERDGGPVSPHHASTVSSGHTLYSKQDVRQLVRAEIAPILQVHSIIMGMLLLL